MADAGIFSIGADGVDVSKIVADIEASVARKMEEGVYHDVRVARAEKSNMAQLRTQEEFLAFYMRCISEAANVDINDFEISEKRGGPAGRLLVLLKTIIWKLLKFYTYRLWSQQNQVNSLLVSAIETLDEKYADRITELEHRIAALEKPGSH